MLERVEQALLAAGVSGRSVLLAVSDPTRRGIQAAARIIELSKALGLRIGRHLLMVNRAKEGQSEAIEKAVSDFDLELLGSVPEDPLVQEFDLNGKPTFELGKDSVALRAAYEIFEKIVQA